MSKIGDNAALMHNVINNMLTTNACSLDNVEDINESEGAEFRYAVLIPPYSQAPRLDSLS